MKTDQSLNHHFNHLLKNLKNIYFYFNLLRYHSFSIICEKKCPYILELLKRVREIYDLFKI